MADQITVNNDSQENFFSNNLYTTLQTHLWEVPFSERKPFIVPTRKHITILSTMRKSRYDINHIPFVEIFYDIYI